MVGGWFGESLGFLSRPINNRFGLPINGFRCFGGHEARFGQNLFEPPDRAALFPGVNLLLGTV
jgi:hypothetical protein